MDLCGFIEMWDVDLWTCGEDMWTCEDMYKGVYMWIHGHVKICEDMWTCEDM